MRLFSKLFASAWLGFGLGCFSRPSGSAWLGSLLGLCFVHRKRVELVARLGVLGSRFVHRKSCFVGWLFIGGAGRVVVVLLRPGGRGVSAWYKGARAGSSLLLCFVAWFVWLFLVRGALCSPFGSRLGVTRPLLGGGKLELS